MTDETPQPKRRAKAPPPRPTRTSSGGKTALTPAMTAAVCDAIRGGSTYKHAAAAQGITAQTLTEWEQRGARGEEPFAAFALAVARARSEAISGAMQGVKSGVLLNGTPDWKALREWLAMIAPDEFAPTATIELKVRGQAQDDLLDRLREGLDTATYGRVLAVLVGGGGEAGAGEGSAEPH